MTEQEWLTSDDPQAMLRVARGRRSDCCGCLWSHNEDDTLSMFPGHRCCPRCDNRPFLDGYTPLASPRKLRLFACACCRSVSPREGCDWPRFLQAVSDLERAADLYAYTPTSLMSDYFNPDWDAATLATWAARDCPAAPDLLRDVVGNPFRRVTLLWVPHYSPVFGAGRTCPWLTPTVLSLAQAAYEERSGRECERCKQGVNPIYTAGTGKLRWHAGDGSTGLSACPDCHGVGRALDSTLDPVRLMVLADALEEAGCPAEVQCWHCNGEGGWHDDGGFKYFKYVHNTWRKCCPCRESGRVPHPLLAHLRSPGPHVRGCWAVDLVLGKE